MRRTLLLATAAVLLAPAVAAAAPFGELPFRPVSGVATCLRPTGVPGQLARWTKGGLELLRADAAGLTPIGTVPLGPTLACPEIAGQANGAAVAAISVATGVRVAVREPGGGFGAPVTLPVARAGGFETEALAVAASPRGDAVVAVLLTDLKRGHSRVLAFQRPARGVFGAVEQVSAWQGSRPSAGLAAGADGAGRLTLAWAGEAVETATAPPGGAFGAPDRVGESSPIGGRPALTVAPDGRALIAFEGVQTGVTVAEREPGAERFGPALGLRDAGGAFGAVSVALADSGAAVVAWRPDELETSNGVRLSSRAAAGPFGAARTAAPGRRRRNGNSVGIYGTDGPPQDAIGLAAAIAGASVVLTWADDAINGGTGVLQAASGALAGGPLERTSLGGPVRPAVSNTSLTLADGRAAIAWADDAATIGGFPTGQGRLHLALAGAPAAADAPPPGVTVPRPVRRRLYVDDPIVVGVHCAAACDVRASAAGGEIPAIAVGGRSSAGDLTLKVYGFHLVTSSTTHVDVTLLAGAPGSRATATQRVRVPVRLRPSPPLPVPLRVRARRSGDDVIVTWHTAFAARRTVFLVTAERGRDEEVASRDVHGRGRRSFRVTLRHAAAARRVTVEAYGTIGQRPRERTVTVR